MRLQTPNEFYSTQEPVANIESSLPSSNPSTTTVEEARIRAKILHETFHGVLQVVHRDFFREDQKLVLPSKSLEDVFSDLAKTHQIELRWLAVNTNAMRSNTSQRATLSK
jgi:hypothetical protein